MGFIKQLFCDHVSLRCLTNFNLEYIDDLKRGKKNNKMLWQCERCGKIITKKYFEGPATINWENINVKDDK